MEARSPELKSREGLRVARLLMVLSSISPLFILWAIRGNTLIPDRYFIAFCALMVAMHIRRTSCLLSSPSSGRAPQPARPSAADKMRYVSKPQPGFLFWAGCHHNSKRLCRMEGLGDTSGMDRASNVGLHVSCAWTTSVLALDPSSWGNLTSGCPAPLITLSK